MLLIIDNVVVFTGILRSKFDREESLQCLKEINAPILSLFGDHDNVSYTDHYNWDNVDSMLQLPLKLATVNYHISGFIIYLKVELASF